MGYVFDAMTKAGPVRKTARRPAQRMPEIETIAIVPSISRDDAPAESADAARPQSLSPSYYTPGPIEPTIAAPPPSIVAALPLLTETIGGIHPCLVSITRPGSAIAEEYRTIRTHLLVRYDQRRHLIHCVASTTPGEGATVTALNLGFAFSELADRTTLIVEANLRGPSFSRTLGIPARPGLVQVLRGEATMDDAARTIGRENVRVLTAGAGGCTDAVQLLASQAFADLMHGLRHRYDHVIVDVAPALELADAGIVGALADDVTLVVRSGATPRPLIEQAIARLKSHNVPLGGIVLTAAAPTPARYRYEGK